MDSLDLMKKAMNQFDISYISAFSALIDLIVMASLIPVLSQGMTYIHGLIVLNILIFLCVALFGTATFFDYLSSKTEAKSNHYLYYYGK